MLRECQNVTCQVSHFFLTKGWSLSVEGLLSRGLPSLLKALLIYRPGVDSAVLPTPSITRPRQSVPNSGFHLVGPGLILVILV